MTDSSNLNSKKSNENKVNLFRNEGTGTIRIAKSEGAGTIRIVKSEGTVNVVRDKIQRSKNKKLKELINRNCPKDEVISFVIGVGSLSLPTIDAMIDLFNHITDEKQAGEEGAVLAIPKGKITEETLEKLISQIRNGCFTKKNLLILWRIAKDVRKRKIMIGVLVSLGIAFVAVGAVFALNAVNRSDSNKKSFENDDTAKEKNNNNDTDVTNAENDDEVDCDEDEDVDEVYNDELADKYEFYKEWLNRDDELRHMSLEDFDWNRRVEEYGLSDDEMIDFDDYDYDSD